MTDKQTPPDWVLIEAAKRCGWNFVLVTLERLHREDVPFRALCDMIAKHEQPPVDRKLLCARKARALSGVYPNYEDVALRAIEAGEHLK